MAYRRRRYTRRRRRYRKKNPYVSTAAKYAGMAYTAYKGVKYLKGLVNSEKHFRDFNSATSIDDSGQIFVFTTIAQGDDVGDRNGNSILVKGLFGRLSFDKHASATSTYIRVIFFREDQQVADTAPGVTDVLETSAFDSALNLDTRGRFKILKDMVVTLDSAKNTNAFKKFNIVINKHMKFNGSANTDIQKGGLYMLMISNEATNTPTIGAKVRISYHDN